MAAVIIERELRKRLSGDDLLAIDRNFAWCLEMYRARPCLHYLAYDGSRLACVFDAPDAEAMRNVVRSAPGSAPKHVWAATLHGDAARLNLDAAPTRSDPNNSLAVVERSFATPVTFDEVEGIVEEGIRCFDLHRVRYLRSYFALDRQRMLCLYEAPDVEAVRMANRQAGVPFDVVWGADVIQPGPLADR